MNSCEDHISTVHVFFICVLSTKRVGIDYNTTLERGHYWKRKGNLSDCNVIWSCHLERPIASCFLVVVVVDFSCDFFCFVWMYLLYLGWFFVSLIFDVVDAFVVVLFHMDYSERLKVILWIPLIYLMQRINNKNYIQQRITA